MGVQLSLRNDVIHKDFYERGRYVGILPRIQSCCQTVLVGQGIKPRGGRTSLELSLIIMTF